MAKPIYQPRKSSSSFSLVSLTWSVCRVADHHPDHFEFVLSAACPVSDGNSNSAVGVLGYPQAGQVSLAFVKSLVCVNLLVAALAPRRAAAGAKNQTCDVQRGSM